MEKMEGKIMSVNKISIIATCKCCGERLEISKIDADEGIEIIVYPCSTCIQKAEEKTRERYKE